MIACFSTSFAHSMETDSLTITPHASFMYDKTIINLTKGPITAADGKVDLIVVGDNQQRMLRHPSFADIPDIATISYPENNIIYKKNSDDESASDDDEYKPYPSSKKIQQLWQKAEHKTMSCPVMRITEPCLTKKHYYNIFKKTHVKDFMYETKNPDTSNKHGSYTVLDGDKAIEQARLDLIKCYFIALFAGLEKQCYFMALFTCLKKLSFNKEKSIALAPLGVDVGIPREDAAQLALKTILTFIKDNPDAYDRIELFVTKRSEFETYKELLIQYAEKK